MSSLGKYIGGAIVVFNDDGKEELLEKGDVFYLPAGHTAIVQEDVKLIDFNPTKEFNEVITHVGIKMAELGG